MEAVTPEQRAAVGELRRRQTGSDKVPPPIAREHADGGEHGVNVEFARRVEVSGKGEAWLAPGDGAICLISTDPRQGLPSGFTTKCKPTAQVATGALYSTWIAGQNPETGRTIVLGVVPDGVRTVLVVDDDGSRRVVPVRHNVYSVWGGRARWVEFDTPSGRRRTRV